MPTELIRRRVVLDADLFAGVANANRTPGIHLTDVLKDIELMLHRAKPSDFTEEDLSQYALQGYLHEDAVEMLMNAALKEKVKTTDGGCLQLTGYRRVPELAIKLDGSAAFGIDANLPVDIRVALTRGFLIVSPDGMVGFEQVSEALAECKWTTKSANMVPERDKRVWFHQTQSYLVVLSVWLQRVIRRVEWHVQFACGDRWGVPPIYEVWSREYEPHESYGSFKMVTDHVEYRTAGDPTKGGGTDPCGWRQWL